MTVADATQPLPAATRLRADHLDDPIGLDDPRPWLSWILPAACAVQTACTIAVASSRDDLLADRPRWQRSVETGHPALRWPGEELTSRERLHWRVRVRDDRQRWSDWSAPAVLEMGLLTPDDWAAEWVEARGHGTALLRCPFTLERPLAQLGRARFHGTAAGLLVPHLNGCSLGEQVLAPDYTDASRLVPYLTLPVEEHLQEGGNCLAIALGGGWYENQGYGRRRMLVQLELDWIDGERQVVGAAATDWSCTAGPWRREDIFDGESYDARLAVPGWDEPGDPSGDWLGCGRGFAKGGTDGPGGVLVGRRAPDIRVVRQAEPRLAWRPRPDRLLLDFGVQDTGWLRITGRGRPGAAVTLQFAELLDEDGEDVATRTLWGAASQDRYVFASSEEESWRPCFTYHGFRYVRVQADPDILDALSCRAEYLRTACEVGGSFASDHADLERLFDSTRRSIASTMQGVWIDCPSRDERQGYLGDTLTGIGALFDTVEAPAFIRKWAADMRQVQDDANGVRWARMAPPCARHIPHQPRLVTHATLQRVLHERQQADSVYTAALTIVPWEYHRETGDDRLLSEHGPAILQHLRRMRQRDDWPLPTCSRGDYSQYHYIRSLTPGSDPRLIAGAVHLWELQIARRIATVLAWPGEVAQELDEAMVRVRSALQERFCQAGHFGSQAGNALALVLGFAPSGSDAAILQALVDDLEANDGHLTTGIVGTRFLFEALSRGGRHDLVLRAITAPGEPGWHWMLAGEATALAEHLVTRWPNTVRNHRIFVMVGEWIMRHVAGIRQADESIGFDQVRIAPGLLDRLVRYSATRPTVRGPVSVAWDGPAGRLDCVLPGGCTGVLEAPAGWQASTTRLQAGAQGILLERTPTSAATGRSR